MNRINQCLQRLQAEGRKALVPYVVSGDPVPEATLPIMHALVAQGADVIELGIPFSDPAAEGPVIQKGHERALANHVSLKSTLDLVKEFRATDSKTPVVLMGYANPVERMGYERFIEEAGDAGVDGVLTVDLPPEEAEVFNSLLRAAELENIFLIAPTTSDSRIARIASLASGYLYYVSLKGVTGAGHLDTGEVRDKLVELKAVTDLPVFVGFGIKDNATASNIAAVADGVIVGSVLVNKIAELAESGERDGRRIAEQVSAIIGGMRQAIDNL